MPTQVNPQTSDLPSLVALVPLLPIFAIVLFIDAIPDAIAGTGPGDPGQLRRSTTFPLPEQQQFQRAASSLQFTLMIRFKLVSHNLFVPFML